MKIIIGIILYISIGILIATHPKRKLKKVEGSISKGKYDPLEVYDLLLFNTFMEVSSTSTKVFVFICIVLFYPILLLNNIIKQKRNRKYKA